MYIYIYIEREREIIVYIYIYIYIYIYRCLPFALLGDDYNKATIWLEGPAGGPHFFHLTTSGTGERTKRTRTRGVRTWSEHVNVLKQFMNTHFHGINSMTRGYKCRVNMLIYWSILWVHSIAVHTGYDVVRPMSDIATQGRPSWSPMLVIAPSKQINNRKYQQLTITHTMTLKHT